MNLIHVEGVDVGCFGPQNGLNVCYPPWGVAIPYRGYKNIHSADASDVLWSAPAGHRILRCPSELSHGPDTDGFTCKGGHIRGIH
jgi:hypothetical protein